MRDFLNHRYSGEQYAYGKNPNNYFKKVLKSLKPGKILLPAEGEGRNAVFAAALGWEVFAYDFSEVAHAKAMALASEKKVSLNYQIASLSEIEFPNYFFDAIGLIYVHFPDHIRRSNHRHLEKLLAPGGNLILEAFSKNHIEYQQKNPSVGGPKIQSQLYRASDLEADFKSSKMMLLQERAITLSEGDFHVGEASVIRMHGVKN